MWYNATMTKGRLEMGMFADAAETHAAVAVWVEYIENVANGEGGNARVYINGTTDDLDSLTNEMFTYHPLTQLLTCIEQRNPKGA